MKKVLLTVGTIIILSVMLFSLTGCTLQIEQQIILYLLQ